MFKAILTYVAVKNVIIFAVLAAMMLGMLAVAAAFWFFAPAASADEMDPYEGYWIATVCGKPVKMYIDKDGLASVVYPDNERQGVFYNTYVDEEGRLNVVDGSNVILTVNDRVGNTLVDDDGDVWYNAD